MAQTKHYQLLDLSPDDCPPNHYALLAIPLFEQDPSIIFQAALNRIEKVRPFQISQKAKDCQKLLSELATAQTVLRDPSRKSQYDAQLREQYGLEAEKSLDEPVAQTRDAKTQKKPGSRRVDVTSRSLSGPRATRQMKSAQKKSAKKIFGAFTETQVITASVSLTGFIFVILLIAAMTGSGPDRVADNREVSQEPEPPLHRPGNPIPVISPPPKIVDNSGNSYPTSPETTDAEGNVESERLPETADRQEQPEDQEPEVSLTEPSGPPDDWVPFQSFPSGVDLPRIGEESTSLAGVTHLAGQPVSVSYESLGPKSQIVLREEGDGQWAVVTDQGTDVPVASLRREGDGLIWEWAKEASKTDADALRNGFLLFKSTTHEKRVALRNARAADSFTWTFNDEAEEKNKAAVTRRSTTVDGMLPEGMLLLEVQLPDGRIKTKSFPTPVIIKLPGEDVDSVARLTAKWKIKLKSLAEGNEEGNGGDTKIILEQHLQITIGGGTIPAKMDKILERDSQLMKKYKVEFAKLQNAKKQRDSIQNEFRQIQRQRASAKRLQTLTHLEGLMAEVNLKLARHNRLAGKWKNTILGAEQFGAQVLRPAKGKAFHYRLYLQREGDGKQIDLMRSWEEELVGTQLESTLFAHSVQSPINHPLSEWFVISQRLVR